MDQSGFYLERNGGRNAISLIEILKSPNKYVMSTYRHNEDEAHMISVVNGQANDSPEILESCFPFLLLNVTQETSDNYLGITLEGPDRMSIPDWDSYHQKYLKEVT